MAVIQSRGRPSWVRNGRDLAGHFVEVIGAKSNGATEVHVVFDRYDVPNTLKEGTLQKRQGTNRAVVYNITVDAVIDKITMKDLLSCNQNKEALAIFLAAQLIECKKDSQTTYVVASKGDCMASNSLSLQDLRSEQGRSRYLYPPSCSRCHTERSYVHNNSESRCRCTHSDAMDLQETLSRY